MVLDKSRDKSSATEKTNSYFIKPEWGQYASYYTLYFRNRAAQYRCSLSCDCCPEENIEVTLAIPVEARLYTRQYVTSGSKPGIKRGIDAG